MEQVSWFLNYMPLDTAVFFGISTLLTAAIIYFWMKLFHEPPHPLHAVMVGFIANFQNFAILLLVRYLPIPYIFQLAPIIFWVLLIKIFYSELDWKHVLAIAILSYGTFTLLSIYRAVEVIQNSLPVV